MNTYRLYIDDAPQPDRTRMSATEAKRAAEVHAEHWPGYEWRVETTPTPGTAFTVRHLYGTVTEYASHQAWEADLRNPASPRNMNDYRRACAAYIRAHESKLERAA
ncbi:MAG TPA: hypothetical protein VKP65_20080 [Rhodothermales bacterium]|nr:hypothetical protein [Rhodothermales bacterium]